MGFGEKLERGAPRGAAPARRRHRHRAHRRHLRPGRGRSAARPGARGRRPRRLQPRRRDRPRLLRGRARRPARASRASPTRACADPGAYAGYLRTAAERSLERIGSDRFDLLLLHNPDRTGYTSEVVWDGMAALRDEGLAAAIGVAPGPANGFTLDLLDCFERFGERIDWAMVILNPLEPWPGELVLDAAADSGIAGDHPGRRLRRPVLGRRRRRSTSSRSTTTARFRPEGWVEARPGEARPRCARSPSATG